MSQKRIRYTDIIWDWNGTLFNDVELCADIMNGLLSQESLPRISIRQYKEIFTFPVEEYYRKAGHTFQKRSFEELGAQFMDEYELRKNTCSPFPGVVELLHKLKEMKIQQHLLSAYEQNSLQSIVQSFNIDNYFTNILGLDNIYASGKLHLAQKLLETILSEGNSRKILLIGDTIHDYEVAKLIDSDCILLTHGHQDETRLMKLETPVANNFNDLARLLVIP